MKMLLRILLEANSPTACGERIPASNRTSMESTWNVVKLIRMGISKNVLHKRHATLDSWGISSLGIESSVRSGDKTPMPAPLLSRHL